MQYSQFDKAQLEAEYQRLSEEYKETKAKGLKLDMSRGKPEAAQLDLANQLMNTLHADSDLTAENGFDCRNYGVLDGIPE